MLLQRRKPIHHAGYGQTVNALYNSAFHIYDDEDKKIHTDTILKTDPTIWGRSVSNEFGRLAQGVRNVEGNDVIEFIKKVVVTRNKRAPYTNMVHYYRPLKLDKWRTTLIIVYEYLRILGGLGITGNHIT